MKFHILFYLCLILFAIHIPAESQDVTEVNAGLFFDDAITIDGRTYKVSPDLVLPVGIDKDSPVKLLFSEDTHELLRIERLIEDDSDSNELEYHFGIVNAITRSNIDLENRVYWGSFTLILVLAASVHVILVKAIRKQKLSDNRFIPLLPWFSILTTVLYAVRIINI